MKKFMTLKNGCYILIYLSLWVFFPALLIVLVPGIFLFEKFSFWRDKKDFLIWWGGINFISFAFWIVILWLSMIPNITIMMLFHTFIGIFFIYGFFNIPILQKPDKYSLPFLILILLLLFMPFMTRIAFSVGDMTMNMYTAKVIQFHNGVPNTHEPFLAIITFGQYALGSHLLTAILSMLSGVPIFRISLFIFCYIFHLLFLSFYFLIEKPNKKITIAFIATFIFFFFSHYPQFLFQWGSSTTALSLVFLILLFPLLSNLKEASILDIIIISFLCASAPLSHFVPVLGFLLFFPAYFLIFRGIPKLDDIKKFFIIISLSLIFCLGQIIRLPERPNSQWVDWAYNWNLSQLEAVQPLIKKIFSIQDISILNIPLAYIFILGPLTSILPFIIMFFIKDKKSKILFGIFLLISLLILLSKIYPFLPLNYAIFPERVLIFMGVPIIFIYNQFFQKISNQKILIIIASFLILFIISGSIIHQYTFKSYYRLYKEKIINPLKLILLNSIGSDYIAYAFDDINSSFTEDELDVILWIKENIPKDEIIDCNYYEGGHLIPIIAENKILFPHYQRFWYNKYMIPWQEKQNVKYYFKSQKSYFQYQELNSEIWEEIYRKGNAAIYKKI